MYVIITLRFSAGIRFADAKHVYELPPSTNVPHSQQLTDLKLSGSRSGVSSQKYAWPV
jgi:hypothetical protein